MSDRVFKIGSAVKGDLTCIKKQFDQLSNQTSFTIIDLKEYVLRRGILQKNQSGSLDSLVDKVLGLFLPKDDVLRKNDQWESLPLAPDLLHYAALDVYASYLIFEKATNLVPFDQVTYDTAGGTPVALLVHEGGIVAAYGKIADVQPASMGGVQVQVPTKSRMVVNIETVLCPSAAAILHLLPQSQSLSSQKTKAGAYTLGQLHAASSAPTFQIVTPIALLTFDHRNPVSSNIFYYLNNSQSISMSDFSTIDITIFHTSISLSNAVHIHKYNGCGFTYFRRCKHG
jgi:hypothetical protein